jgi:hypothetical protein
MCVHVYGEITVDCKLCPDQLIERVCQLQFVPDLCLQSISDDCVCRFSDHGCKMHSVHCVNSSYLLEWSDTSQTIIARCILLLV